MPVVDGLVQRSYFLDTPEVVRDMRQLLAGTPSDEISARKYVKETNR